MTLNRDIQNVVEKNSLELEVIVHKIVDKYTLELDEYMNKIRTVLEADSEELTLDDLQRIMIRLCSYSYFISSKQELVGIRQDISEAIKSEKFNDAYMNITSGTIAKKTAEANAMVKEEALVALVYTRAYKILKGKMDSTNRTVDAVKKIITARLQTMQLTGMAGV